MIRKPDFQRGADEARRLLRKYSYDRPPIDPEKIAEDEGLRVIYADFESPDSEEVSGFFRLNEKSIIINNDISDNRITFTIAHELAHYYLHQEYIKSNNYIPMPRWDEYGSEKPVEEIEADNFAANLLVPLRMLKHYKNYASEYELSRLFFVSEDVIRNRLSTLTRYPKLAGW